MLEHIIEIINKWDPVDLNGISPSDEYLPEVKQIISYLSKEVSLTELAHNIYSVFCNAFDEMFHKSYDECFSVASQIIQALDDTGDDTVR